METVHQTEMVNREGNMDAKKFTTILDMLDRYQDSEKIALICGKEQLAYRELIADARHIARGLLAAGVQKGGRVLFSMHRKADAIRALFGILYAGASYVAADPEWPKVRMEFVQRDAQTVFAMTDETCRSLREKEPSAAELPKVTGEDEVAVYYTSGSMGQPKGVVLQHIAFGSTFWGTHVYAQRGTIFQCIYKFTYVVATIHLFAVLSKGKTLLLSTDAEECCAELLAAAMERHCADAIAGTPSVLLRFLEDSSFARAFAGVKCVSLSGERIHPSVAQRLSKFAKGCVLSYYGTSEMAGCAEYCYENDSKIHLGNAAYGVRLHLLDETMEEIPSGGEGELFIGGIPAKYGHYLNRPDLDAEKYVEHLRLGRLFRTGDLARLETDGEITLLGRKDSMVKLHGQRIEIGEVEDAMVSFPGIRRTAVRLLGESPHEMLAGYYTADGEVSEAELRQHLADRLPHYMVPALFMKLKAMPENANGKLDYRALPPIELPKEEYVPPETAREKVLCEFFAQVLKLKDLVVGVNDSFFALGGDSIAGMQLIGLLMERYNISCTMNQLVIHPTPAALAQILSEASVKKEQSQRAASYQIRNYPRSLEGILEDSHIEAALPVNGSTTAFLYMKQEGIRDRFNTSRLQIKIGASWREETFRARVSALVKNHPALRSFFHRDENGKYWQIIRSTNETPVWFKNISYLAPEAAETFVRGFWQVMEGEEALFAAACFVWDAKTILLVQADHTIADGMSMHIIANELAAESYQDLPVDGYIAHRKRTLGSREDITPFILDYYGKGNPSFSSVDPMSLGDQGIRRETVALSRQDTERFSQNCAAAGILPYSMVFYCYGQAILSVSEIDEVWLMMLDSGRYAEWGDELRIVGNIINGMPVRIARGMTAQEFQKDLLCLRECHHLQDSVLLYDRKWNRIPEGIISNDFVELDPVIESLEILGDDKRRGNSMELLDGCLTIRLRHADLEPVSEWYQKVAKELSLRLQAACK